MNIQERIAAFVAGVTQQQAAFPSVLPRVASVEIGRAYARIILSDASSRFAFCFIDLTTGDILKAASWKAPAKHKRGSIMGEDFGLSQVTRYGAHYLR